MESGRTRRPPGAGRGGRPEADRTSRPGDASPARYSVDTVPGALGASEADRQALDGAVVQLRAAVVVQRDATGGGGARPSMGTNVSESGGDPEQADGTLPFTASGGDLAWDDARILSGLTQHDDDTTTVADRHRCTAQATLGAHVRTGPEAVALVGDDTARRLGRYLPGQPDAMMVGLVCRTRTIAGDPEAIPPEQLSSEIQALHASVSGVAARVRGRTATFQDLRRLADGMQLAANLSGRFAGGTAHSLAGIGGGNTGGSGESSGTGWAPLEDFVRRELVPHRNRAFILRVHTVVANGMSPAERGPNHALTLGVDAAGSVYVYEPSARHGTQLLRWDTHRAQIRAYVVDVDVSPEQELGWMAYGPVPPPAGLSPGGAAGGDA